MLWISQGKAARDETAFRHALKTGYRLRAAGERMTDAAILMPTSTSPTATAQTDATTRCRPGATAKQWPGACVATSPSQKQAQDAQLQPNALQPPSAKHSPR